MSQKEMHWSPGTSSEPSELCQFYVKIGACRHGEKCSRIHKKPKRTGTIVMKNLYRQAKIHLFPYGVDVLSDSLEQSIFDEFYEEVYREVEETCGRIREMLVCENHGAHLAGNVYIRFFRVSSAVRSIRLLSNRFFAGSTIDVELSPVEDFLDACCRQHQMGSCSRGGICNFMHIRAVSGCVRARLHEKARSKDLSTTEESESEREDERVVREKRRRRSKSENEEEDEQLPSKYKTEEDSCSSLSSSESSSHPHNSDSDSTDSRATPKAFRTDRFDTQSECESEEDAEMTDEQREHLRKKKQTIRHRRWAQLKAEFDNDWDEEKERNYVFSLL